MTYVASKQLGGVIDFSDVTTNSQIGVPADLGSARSLIFHQTTVGVQVTLANPTPTDQRLFTVVNRGTTSIMVQGVTIEPGPAYGIYWNGATYVGQAVEGVGTIGNVGATNSVSLTGDGSETTPLEATVKISATVNNAITVESDGLFVQGYPDVGGGNILYVDNSAGSDTSGNGSQRLPYKTLTKALQNAANNNAIGIYPGVYNENITGPITPTNLTLFGMVNGNPADQPAVLTGIFTASGTGQNIRFKGLSLSNATPFKFQNHSGVINIEDCAVTSVGSGDSITFTGDCSTILNIVNSYIPNNIRIANDNASFVNTVTVNIFGHGVGPNILEVSRANAKVLVSGYETLPNILHTKGQLFVRKTNLVGDGSNVGLNSTADASGSNTLILDNVSFQKADGTFADLVKTGACPFLFNNVSVDKTNDTFTGTQVFGQNAFMINADYDAPVNYHPTGGTIDKHLEAIDAQLGAIGGGGLTSVTTTDTSTIDFSGAGTNASPLTATVKVSAASDNVITVNSDGISVSSSNTGIAQVTHDNSDTVSLTGLGTVGDPLVADTFISTTAHNQLKKDSGGLIVPEIQQTIELVFQVDYAYLANQFLFVYKASKPFTLPANLVGSQSKVSASPQITDAITLAKNGTSIGSINIINNVVSFTFSADVSFVAGDELTAVAGNADKQFDYVSFTLFGTRPYVNA